MRGSLGFALAVILGCATGSYRVAEGQPDWAVVDERWSVHLVTEEPDGDERTTRIWLATVDGIGVIRTGASRWLKNLTKNPECRLRVLGVDYPLRVEFVTAPEEIGRIDAAFVEKYGWQERVVTGSQPRDGEDYFMRLLPRK